jgi:Mor family transcriptional regulator
MEVKNIVMSNLKSNRGLVENHKFELLLIKETEGEPKFYFLLNENITEDDFHFWNEYLGNLYVELKKKYNYLTIETFYGSKTPSAFGWTNFFCFRPLAEIVTK